MKGKWYKNRALFTSHLLVRTKLSGKQQPLLSSEKINANNWGYSGRRHSPVFEPKIYGNYFSFQLLLITSDTPALDLANENFIIGTARVSMSLQLGALLHKT